MRHRAVLIAGPVLIVLSVARFAGAVDKRKAMYVGGTVTVMSNEAVGHFDLKDPDKLLFTVEDSPQKREKGRVYELPWSRVDSVEYGQKVGHRVKTAIFLSPLSLFSKKRRHYVTLNYRDLEGVGQAVVFEVGKEVTRETLAVIKARTGKDVQPTDDEARKQLGKP
jgi:hypothetical protein